MHRLENKFNRDLHDLDKTWAQKIYVESVLKLWLARSVKNVEHFCQSDSDVDPDVIAQALKTLNRIESVEDIDHPVKGDLSVAFLILLKMRVDLKLYPLQYYRKLLYLFVKTARIQLFFNEISSVSPP